MARKTAAPPLAEQIERAACAAKKAARANATEADRAAAIGMLAIVLIRLASRT